MTEQIVRALVLWDVDHTLIENGGVSKDNYVRAFELLTGVPCEHPPQTDGRTDYEIVGRLFEAHGRGAPARPAAAAALIRAMSENTGALRERGHALPGAADAIKTLASDERLVQSLLTGNIRANAEVKVSTFGLQEGLDLDVGGYGDDDEQRHKLVPVAQERASAKYGVTFDRRSTVLVGDTTRDVRAGLEGGASVIGVATGTDTTEALASAGAMHALVDLTDADAVLSAVRDLVL